MSSRDSKTFVRLTEKCFLEQMRSLPRRAFVGTNPDGRADNFPFARHPPGIQQLFGSQNEASQSRVDVR